MAIQNKKGQGLSLLSIAFRMSYIHKKIAYRKALSLWPLLLLVSFKEKARILPGKYFLKNSERSSQK
jgi:hypothetical protein